MHRLVQQVGRVPLLLELGDDMLDVLRAVLVRDQNSVRGVDDNQVLDADQSGQAMVALHIVVEGVVLQDLALKTVLVVIRRRELADGRPGADIAPADIARHRSHLV
ncbi:hypothetical protein D3C80_1883350 [compost metagenome]